MSEAWPHPDLIKTLYLHIIQCRLLGVDDMPNTTNAPGKHYRKGLTLVRAVEFFSKRENAEEWFIAARWAEGVRCPFCDSENITERKSRKPQRFFCGPKGCGRYFSVKTRTLMHGSKLSLGTWGLAYYLYVTSLKGVSSMKLHRDLGVTQKTAWYMGHRIRASLLSRGEPFTGPAEADETYIGGRRKNMHSQERKKRKGRGTAGKIAVAGIKDRETNKIDVAAVGSTDARTLQRFVQGATHPESEVYTDEHPSYKGIMRKHLSVKHSVGEYVDDQIHTNGIESFWSMLKRGIVGTYHHISPKHTGLYAEEFAGRHNVRPMDTVDQMALAVQESEGKRLSYKQLIGKAD